MPVLYESISPRGDHGIWYLTYGQPSKTPFHFDWLGKTLGGQYLNLEISETCYVKATFKEFLDDEENILEYTLQMGKNNTVMIVISEEDSFKMKEGITYHLTITLYDQDNNVIKVLLRDLPVYIMGRGV